MADKARVAVVGTGFGASTQVPGFRALPEIEVAAICSGRAERAEAVARELDIPAWYADYDRMLREVKPDLVSIVTPPALHRPMTLAALQAGAHVICEKPFALNAAEAREMLQAAEAAGRVHVIDHEFRFVPARRYQKALVDQGYVGQVRLLEATGFMSGRADPQREWNWWADAAQGGGMLGAIGSHFVDAFRWLTDSEVRSVSAVLNTFIAERPFGEERRPVSSDDSCALIVHMANGAQGVMHLSAVAPVPVMRLGVYGSDGFVMVEDERRLTGARRGGEAEPIDIPPDYLPIGWREDRLLQGPFAHLAERMLRAMRAGERVTPNFEDGLRIQLVLDAAREAARTGQSVSVPGPENM